MRSLRKTYRLTGKRFEAAGSTSDGYLRAWEYEPAEACWPVDEEGDVVRLWRTRRPDLAPPEIYVGDRER